MEKCNHIITIRARVFVENGGTKEIGRISTFGEYDKVRKDLRQKIILRYPKLDFFTIRQYNL